MWSDIFEIRTQTEEERQFHNDVLSHNVPLCPKCKIGKIVCPQGKIPKPHFFECTNNCGWYMNIDYNDVIVE